MTAFIMSSPYAPNSSAFDPASEGRPGPFRALALYAPLVLVLGTSVVVGPQQMARATTEGTSVYSHFATSRSEAQLADFDVVAEIDEIRESLRLTVTDIAKALGKSRQAVYKWLTSGAQPEASTEAKIRLLTTVARSFTSAGVRRPDSAVKMGIVGGQSLLDLVRTEELTAGHIQAAIHEATASAATHSAATAGESGTLLSEEWMASMSIPGGRE